MDQSNLDMECCRPVSSTCYPFLLFFLQQLYGHFQPFKAGQELWVPNTVLIPLLPITCAKQRGSKRRCSTNKVLMRNNCWDRMWNNNMTILEISVREYPSCSSPCWPASQFTECEDVQYMSRQDQSQVAALSCSPLSFGLRRFLQLHSCFPQLPSTPLKKQQSKHSSLD